MKHICAFLHILICFIGGNGTTVAIFLLHFHRKICRSHKKDLSLQKSKLINHVVEGVTEAAVKG